MYEIKLLKEAQIFIKSLDVKLKAKTLRTIELLKDFGPFLTEPHSKKIQNTDNLYELRIKQGTNIIRLFYFYDKDKIYIITNGFRKKQNKTPLKEINKALSLINNYLKGEYDE